MINRRRLPGFSLRLYEKTRESTLDESLHIRRGDKAQRFVGEFPQVVASAGSCIRARSASRALLIQLFKETMERSATPNIGEEKQECPRCEK